MASYVGQNPSSRLAIDGAKADRVVNVRQALINAVVPSDKIQTDAFGDAGLRNDNQVAVLVSR
ncbi:hypothetical protein [Hydrocarboniphaga sp.]|uniref:hypothetical protein n=1 Tax=Hydrocarboniphaga sp. TaxID=2033016 RepID=UPI00261EAC35|nr:hypothetical protein [Hydrocarboniphaga sp.]